MKLSWITALMNHIVKSTIGRGRADGGFGV